MTHLDKKDLVIMISNCELVMEVLNAIYICYSPDERSVLEKTVPEVLDTASGGTRDRGHSFSQYGPTVAGE